MTLNLQMMRAAHACEAGLDWWQSTFGEADVEYGEALRCLVTAGHVAWARWLLDAVNPPNEAAIEVSGTLPRLVHPGSVVVNGSLSVLGPVVVGGALTVQGNLQAAGVIHVGGNLSATSIRASDAVSVGGDMDCPGALTGTSIYAHGRINAGDIVADAVSSDSYIVADSITAGQSKEWQRGKPVLSGRR